MAKPSVVEESFGHHIPQPGLKKGSIAIFGDRATDSNINDRQTFSVNQKTGNPAKGK